MSSARACSPCTPGLTKTEAIDTEVRACLASLTEMDSMVVAAHDLELPGAAPMAALDDQAGYIASMGFLFFVVLRTPIALDAARRRPGRSRRAADSARG